jgi:hypothetical protein
MKRRSAKKRGGAVSVNSQASVLQPASNAPSLDNSFLSQSKLVGGGKKKRQNKKTNKKRRRGSKKGTKKNCWSLW